MKFGDRVKHYRLGLGTVRLVSLEVDKQVYVVFDSRWAGWCEPSKLELVNDESPRTGVAHVGTGHHPAPAGEPAPAEPRPPRGVDGGADAPLEGSPAGGTKHDASKPPLDLLDATALLEVGRVLGFGAKKPGYGPHNWRKGISRERLLAAALRHVLAAASGERKDPESGLSHLAHAMCCCMFALHFEITNTEVPDTRFTK